MLQVRFTGPLRSAVGGADSLEIEARTIRVLLNKLVKQFPALQKPYNSGIAVAIDGEIYRDNWDVEIAANSEVYLLPRITGG